MKVLFISSGNVNQGIVPFIKSQGVSLSEIKELKIEYFPIVGEGIFGYLKSRKEIREYVQNNDIDIVHAHYILSGWAAVLSRCKKPIVLSLMGSDAYGIYNGKRATLASRYLTVLTWLIQPFVDAIISKSDNIASYVYQKSKSYIIPNGIDLEKVKHNQLKDNTNLNLNTEKTNILFLGDPKNPRKNFKLVLNAVNGLNNSDINLITPYPTDHDSVLKYLNSVDVFVMASYMEGSPNVVKEAMACNCPMVVTDVGDTGWVTEGVKGCLVSSFDEIDFSNNLLKAIEFSKQHGKTDGLQRIKKLGLDTKTIASKVYEVYKSVIK